MLFRMVPKLRNNAITCIACFRAVLFRMVPKLLKSLYLNHERFRAVLFRMVQNASVIEGVTLLVLELCCFEWFQNVWYLGLSRNSILRNVLNFSENAFQCFSKVFFYGKIKTEFI